MSPTRMFALPLFPTFTHQLNFQPLQGFRTLNAFLVFPPMALSMFPATMAFSTTAISTTTLTGTAFAASSSIASITAAAAAIITFVFTTTSSCLDRLCHDDAYHVLFHGVHNS